MVELVARHFDCPVHGVQLEVPGWSQFRRLQGSPKTEEIRFEVANLMAKNRVSALIYPHQKCLVFPIGAPFQKDCNGEIAALSGFPAIEVPGGFSVPTEDAPLGVPVGLKILGRAWAEAELIRLAYGFEQASHFRKPPVSTPPSKRSKKRTN